MRKTDLNILVVDDVPNNLFLVREIFDGYPIQCHCAQDAEAAMTLLRETEMDLIILDVQMPVVDGFQLAKQIKNIVIYRDIPMIFLTAEYNDTDSVLRGLNLGAVDYLTKPIDPKILIKKVEIILNLEKEKEELEKQNDRFKRFIKTAPFY